MAKTKSKNSEELAEKLQSAFERFAQEMMDLEARAYELVKKSQAAEEAALTAQALQKVRGAIKKG